MKTDAIESTNVAAQHIDIVEDLKKLMAKFINEGGVQLGNHKRMIQHPMEWKNVSHLRILFKNKLSMQIQCKRYFSFGVFLLSILCIFSINTFAQNSASKCHHHYNR